MLVLVSFWGTWMSAGLLWQILSNAHISQQLHVVFDDVLETVICNGNNDTVVNSICNSVFNWNHKLNVKDEFDADDVLIYTPPLLHEVRLNKAGLCQGKEDLLRQCC
jgi:hypothetical protein